MRPRFHSRIPEKDGRATQHQNIVNPKSRGGNFAIEWMEGFELPIPIDSHPARFASSFTRRARPQKFTPLCESISQEVYLLRPSMNHPSSRSKHLFPTDFKSKSAQSTLQKNFWPLGAFKNIEMPQEPKLFRTKIANCCESGPRKHSRGKQTQRGTYQDQEKKQLPNRLRDCGNDGGTGGRNHAPLYQNTGIRLSSIPES